MIRLIRYNIVQLYTSLLFTHQGIGDDFYKISGIFNTVVHPKTGS